MKNRIYYTIVVCLITNFISIAQEIKSNISGNYFIQGVPLENILSIENIGNTVDEVVFYTLDEDGYVLDSLIDNTINDGFSWKLEMSTLPKNASVYAVAYSNGSQDGNPIENYSFTMIPKPNWLEKGSVENIIMNNNTLSFKGLYPIYKYDYQIANSILIIGDKPLSVAGTFNFMTEFDMVTGKATILESNTQLIMNVLDFQELKEDLQFNTECTIDKDLNIAITASNEIKSKSVNLNSPSLRLTVCPSVTVKIDANIELYATLKGQIVIGQMNGEFGLIESNNKKSKIIGVLTGIGTIRGKVNVGLGTAKATLSLIAKANLGVGFDYVTIPTEKLSPLYGGDLDISGEISVNAFAWFGDGISLYKGSTSFLRTSFGDTSALRSNENIRNNTFNTKSLVIKDSGTMNIPDFSPQPTFFNRDTNLYAVWIEKNLENNQLLLSKLNRNGTKFSKEKVIINHSYPINNPKIGILTDGSALITWTQNRYNQSTIPKDISAEEILKSQDIWFAFYDINQDSITSISKLGDDESSISSGRCEGEATISVNNSNEALITWTSADFLTASSDIWYTYISKENKDWVMTEPEKLIDIPGINSNVNVTFNDSSTALAFWINDPDGDTETLDNDIIFAGWDGSKWDLQTQKLTQNNGFTSFENISLAYKNEKAVLTYASILFEENQTIHKINAEVFDFNSSMWESASSFEDADSLYTFHKPTISISDKGIAALSYQAIEKYSDSSFIDNGTIYLFVKDINTNSDWSDISESVSLSDTNNFIWEMTSGFGNNNKYYTMTQEYDDDGIIDIPSKGILFGDPSLSMILRGYQIENDLSITDIEEPIDVPLGLEKNINNLANISSIYPNPFNMTTTIEFIITSDGHTILDIYNSTGKVVATLQNGYLKHGLYRVKFDSGDLPEGLYYSKLISNHINCTRKLVLIR